MPEPKRQVSAKEVVTDLRAGLTDLELMRKYELSPTGLGSLLGKLVKMGVVDQSELDARKSGVKATKADSPARSRTSPGPARAASTLMCPSCRFQVPSDSDECPRCGIVLRKQSDTTMDDQPRLGPPVGVVTRPPLGQARPMRSSGRVESSAIDSAMIVGVVGSVLLMLGCFSPAVRIGPLGGVNLFSIGQFSQLAQMLGYVLVAIAVTGLVLSVTRNYANLWACGAGAIAILLIALVVFHRKIAESKAAMNAAMSQFQGKMAGPQAEALSSAMSKAMSQMAQLGLGWGWLPLFAGAILLVLACFVAPKESDF